MLLIVRLVTRVAEPVPPESVEAMDEDGNKSNGDSNLSLAAHQDRLRQTLCDYIMDDFPGR